MANPYFNHMEGLLQEIRVNAIRMLRLHQITRAQYNDTMFRLQLAHIQLRNRRNAYNNYMTIRRQAPNNQNNTRRRARPAGSARSHT
jgi:hypothetical protein